MDDRIIALQAAAEALGEELLGRPVPLIGQAPLLLETAIREQDPETADQFMAPSRT